MKKPLNILVLADTIASNSSGGKANMGLIQGFIDQGFDLKVLHYSREEISLGRIPVLHIAEQKTNLSYLKAKTQLLFQRASGRNINKWVETRKGFSYTHDYDVVSIKAALAQENPAHYDYVLALSYASSFRAHKAILQSPAWHAKFLAYIHDPYPMHSYPRPYDWVEPGHQFKRDFFVALFTKARHLIYPSSMLGEWMESYYPTGKNKAVIIPHLIRSDLKDTGVYPAYFNPALFNVLHAGSLMSARNPMSLVRAFIRFLETVPEAQEHARLVMVGGASVYHKELHLIASKTRQLLLSLGQEPFELTYNMQQQAAVNVILEAKGPASPFLPGKVPHCVVADKPILILGPYYSETRNLLGMEYPYWGEINDEATITTLLTSLFTAWVACSGNSTLNKPDIAAYLGAASIDKAFKEMTT